jgi:hypothetical protein
MRADYVWEESYNAAVLETDDTKMPNRLRAAKGAIDTRLQELQMESHNVGALLLRLNTYAQTKRKR